jgi:DNA-binding NtrC family response regulator
VKSSILIVSPDAKKDAFFEDVFAKFESVFVEDLLSALKALNKSHFDICFIQVHLSKKADFHLLKQVQKMDGTSDLLVALRPDQISSAMETLGGHWDYLFQPYLLSELKLKFEKILVRRNLERENRFWRVELAALLADRGTLTLKDIPTEIWEKAGNGKAKEESQSFKRSRKEFERECLRGALERAQGSQTQAAKALGIHRNTLIWKLKKLNLENECKKIVRKRRGH